MGGGVGLGWRFVLRKLGLWCGELCVCLVCVCVCVYGVVECWLRCAWVLEGYVQVRVCVDSRAGSEVGANQQG